MCICALRLAVRGVLVLCENERANIMKMTKNLMKVGNSFCLIVPKSILRLLNIDGDMIGVNVAVRAGAQGIGFAIPVDKAVAVAADLLAIDSMRRTWHGVAPAAESSESGPGLVVRAVDERSPAEKAGLEPGDVLTSIGDLKIVRALDFHRAILGLDVGESISVSVRRGEETLVLTMELAKVPDHLKPAVGPHWELLDQHCTLRPRSTLRRPGWDKR